MKKERTCPLCGNKYTEHPAISRNDNKTEICPDCGIMEALVAAGLADPLDWEIFLRMMRKQKN